MKNDRGMRNRTKLTQQPRAGGVPPASTATSVVVGGVIVATLALCPGTLFAGAVIDTSWGRTAQTLSGNFTIPESSGKVAGTNLFHSFKSFSINTGESATFTTSTATLQNVISRVSGTSPTAINGPLSLRAAAGSAPNFFFINPNGVTFGAGAQVDVPASFHVSTANNLRFAQDGTVFKAGAGPDNTLTVQAPEAFGFLGGAGAKVVFNNLDPTTGQPATGKLTLAVSPGKTFDVTARAIEIDNTSVQASDGSIRLVSVGTRAAKIGVGPGTAAGFSGPITIDSSNLDVSGADGGKIELRGGEVQLHAATLDSTRHYTAQGSSALPPDRVSIDISGENVTLDASSLVSRPEGPVPSGAINVVAKSAIAIDDSSIITSRAFAPSTGKPGDIRIEAGRVTANRFVLGARGSHNTVTDPNYAGSITIKANDGEVTLVSGSINVDSGEFAGTVAVEGKSDVTLNSVTITGTKVPGERVGQAGSIDIKSNAGAVRILGGSRLSETVDTEGIGPAGMIEVAGRSVEISSSFLSTSTMGTGPAGSISITATGGGVAIVNSQVTSDTRRGVYAVPPGVSGNIDIVGTTIGVDQGSLISISAGGPSFYLTTPGHIGSINLIGRDGISVTTGSRIVAETTAETYFGNAPISGSGAVAVSFAGLITPGEIRITSPKLTLTGGSQISARATINNDSSAIVIESRDGRGRLSPLAISGDGTGVVTASASGIGNAGPVSVQSSQLTLSGINLVSEAEPNSSGHAGAIALVADQGMSIVNSRVAADTLGSGAAGSIHVSGTSLNIDSSRISSAANAAAQGNAGTIDIDVTKRVRVSNGSTITSRTESALGRAGSVTVDAENIDVTGGSSINAAAAAGSSGQTGSVTVSATEAINVSNGSSINTRNDATVSVPPSIAPGTLSVAGRNIALDAGQISSASSGNVRAGAVNVTSRNLLTLNNSAISATGQEAGGGAIAVVGGKLVLNNSQISSSVFGSTGNAGNITINAGNLTMQTGFVQANTNAANGLGGNVSIGVTNLIPVGPLFVGGTTPFDFRPGLGFNVIQAAAPNGTTGTVRLVRP